jgi:galactokinase
MAHVAEQRACRAFQSIFGNPPARLASAPGRINLIGEFTDFNGGFVLPMAIEQRTAIAAAPNGSSEIVLHSESTGETVRIDAAQPLVPDRKGRWTNYPKGVLAGFAGLGCGPRGFDAAICSTVPMGAGLSSSAALESATVLVLEGLWGCKLDSVAAAFLCQRAEHEYAQVPCGIMDPFICLMGRAGHAMLLDCQSNTPAWIAWDDPAVSVLVVNTGVKHELSGSEYASRRHACESAAEAMGVTSLREAGLGLLEKFAGGMEPAARDCAHHVIAENLRAQQAADCLRERDWALLGNLMYDSHESLRTGYRVSCRELDLVVDLARDIGNRGGVFGARMTGGGFGGCAIVLIETSRQEDIGREIGQGYRLQTGIEPALFVTRACEGARSRAYSP